jgi:hypothetical protein
MKQGKITPNGVVLHTHENATVVFLTGQGFDVELLPSVQKCLLSGRGVILQEVFRLGDEMPDRQERKHH